MTTTATRKRSSKKTSSKKKASKKRSTKKKTSRKAPTTGARKKSSKKKTAKKASTRRVPPEIVKAEPTAGFEIQGVSVQTSDGRKPRNSATAYLASKQIVIEPGFNPRTSGVGDIEALTASIKEQKGLLQNIVVRPAGDGKKFKLVAGERRLTALRKLGGRYLENIPALIRLDLEKDDDKARAVAVAESSPDGRLNLSPVEVGKVVEDLTKKGWTPARIAKETGLHTRKVQRVLQVMETPKDVQERVHSGEWSQAAAIEFHRLPKEVQKDIKDKVGRETTAQEIRKLRRAAEREVAKEAAAKGKEPKKTKRGTAPTAKAPTWKPAKEKQAMIREMAAELEAFEGEEIGQDDYHEVRGGLAALLWDRGDLESPVLPSIHHETEDDPAAAKKANAYFDSIVKNEASLYVPPEDESAEG